jgi:hypothetical protein
MPTIGITEFHPGDVPGPWWYGVVDADIHVVPVQDLGPHDDRDCPCNPVVEVNAGHEMFQAVVIHTAFDHRELLEVP